ncbi:uncharacterized protein LOC142230673 [Haematobia irritans]|uniref:uncharacterized protein LOC142230673 n=1 Tax=Haematobia irritans TaxID=7368 RepID=UPI003F4F5054
MSYNSHWFINTTQLHIPQHIQWILSLGPKYAFPTTKHTFPLHRCIAEGEECIQAIESREQQERVRAQFTSLIDNHLHKLEHTHRDRMILDTVAQSRKFLKENDEILILCADKGGKTVAMTKADYKTKMGNILMDFCTYRQLKKDPTTSLQNKNNSLVEKLFKDIWTPKDSQGSVPVELAIKTIEKKWNILEQYTNIPRGLFIEILKFCIKDTRYFKYEEKFYSQQKGLPMGSPASPVIADIVMEDLLDDSIGKMPNKPKILTKYVDDLFGIIKKTETINTINLLNSYNKLIQFTMEEENDNKLAYLDTIIQKKIMSETQLDDTNV